MSSTISKSEYALWMSHPMSQALLRFADQVAKQSMDAWLNGSFTQETVDGTAQLNARAQGKANFAAEMAARLAKGEFPKEVMTVFDDKEED